MGTLFRCLVLCNALLLALPPGWCCARSLGSCDRPPPKVEQTTETPSATCCHHREPETAKSPRPIDPRPALPKTCCWRGDATPAAVPKKLQAERAQELILACAAPIPDDV